MATPSTSERVLAHRIRQKKIRRQPITDDEASWLATYDARSARARRVIDVKALPVPAQPAPNGEGTCEPDSPHATASSAPSAWVHTTVPLDDVRDPAAYTWVPEVPPAEAEHEEATPPGAPPPPPAGTPVVDPAAPVPDTKAAQQFAALMVVITSVGIRNALQWLDRADEASIPDEWREAAHEPAAHQKTLEIVGRAAYDVAIKHHFKSVPMADELVVGLAAVGSAIAVIGNQKHKRKRARTLAGAGRAPEEPPKVKLRSVPEAMREPKAPPPPVEGLWDP